MLATPSTRLREGAWAVEPKLDGWRALVTVAQRVTVRSRNGHDISARVPELQQLGSALDGRSVLFDGELILGEGLPADFYALGPRMIMRRPTQAVTFVAFDVLELDGEPIMNLPYSARRVLLEDLVDVGPCWMRMPSFVDDPRGPWVLGWRGAVLRARARLVTGRVEREYGDPAVRVVESDVEQRSHDVVPGGRVSTRRRGQSSQV